MKRCAIPILVCLAFAWPCPAQEEEAALPFAKPDLAEDFEPGRPHWEPPSSGPRQPGRPQGPGARPLERWMKYLETHQPAEFARLQALRESDPEAFRNELQQQLREKLGRAGPGGDRGPGPRYKKRHDQALALDEEARALAADYRAAPEDARSELRTALERKIGEAFDAREAQRAQTIAHMEAKLTRLRDQTAERQTHREEIILRRFQELTESDPLAW